MPLALNQAQSRSALSPKQPLQLQASSEKWQHAHWRNLKWKLSLHHQGAIDTAKLQLWTVAQVLTLSPEALLTPQLPPVDRFQTALQITIPLQGIDSTRLTV